MEGAGEGRYPSLAGRTALVTGAGSGIGRASAVLLAKAGVYVCLLDFHKTNLAAVQQEIENNGGSVLPFVVDVRDSAAVKASIKQAVEWTGSLDIVLSNAGTVGVLTTIEDTAEEEWQRVLNVNLNGAFHTLKHAIPYMKETGGSIIITGSIHGNRIFNSYGMTAYSASKAALTSLAKTAAVELARYKIRVNVICPGAVETNLNETKVESEKLQEVKIPVIYPEGKYPYGKASSEQIAEGVLFLASDQSSYLSGSEMVMDGVRSLL